MKAAREYIPVGFQCITLLSLLAAVLVLDSEFAALDDWRFSLGAALLALMLSATALLSRRWRVTAGMLIPFGLALLVLPLMAWSESKQFLRFHSHIQNGMTLREVQSTVAARYPAGGRFPRPVWRLSTPSQLHYMMDATHDQLDSVFLDFQNRRVVGTSFMGD